MPEEVQNNPKKKTKRRGIAILLILFLLLFLMTTAILGAQLYKLATLDQYTVDLGLGNPESNLELFRIAYENDQGQITVQGLRGEEVVAPGTTAEYDIRLRNNEDVAIDFVLYPTVEFLTADIVPIQFKVIDGYGNYIAGSSTRWADATQMNELAHRGSIHPGEVLAYHISWQWMFEVDEEQDAYDSYLGNQNGQPGVKVSVCTATKANPMHARDNQHMSHLLGRGFGCCWCCWLVWVLVLICLVLTVWVWRLERKLSRMEQEEKEEQDEEQEEEQE